MIVIMPNYYLILIKLIHLLVNLNIIKKNYFFFIISIIEQARINNGRVFIHCLGLYFLSLIYFIYYLLSLAGISRSPALAIAYIMRHLNLSDDDAYQYVKQCRSQISPNFNFLAQLSEYKRKLSLTSNSTSTTTPIVKCVAIETPLNDCRRFVQVEGCSNTDNRPNVLSHPKTLSPLSSTTTNLSVESPQQQSSLRPKLLRPNNISLNRSPLELINSCDELNDSKRIETASKSADSSSLIKETDLINTYFQESTISKSSEECKPAQPLDSTNETKKTNVLSSNVKLRVS